MKTLELLLAFGWTVSIEKGYLYYLKRPGANFDTDYPMHACYNSKFDILDVFSTSCDIEIGRYLGEEVKGIYSKFRACRIGRSLESGAKAPNVYLDGSKVTSVWFDDFQSLTTKEIWVVPDYSLWLMEDGTVSDKPMQMLTGRIAGIVHITLKDGKR